MVYALVYMALILALALFNRVYYASPFPFSFMILIATIFVWFVMNIDFGRYQLSVLSSAINSFRAEKLGDDPEATYQLWWFVNSLKVSFVIIGFLDCN